MTDFSDNTTAPRLQTRLQDSFGTGDGASAGEAMRSTQTFARTDVKNYIHLGASIGERRESWWNLCTQREDRR